MTPRNPRNFSHPAIGPTLAHQTWAQHLVRSIHPDSATHGDAPLRRSMTLSDKVLRAMKNGPSHSPGCRFLIKCCAKNTQNLPASDGQRTIERRATPKNDLYIIIQCVKGDREAAVQRPNRSPLADLLPYFLFPQALPVASCRPLGRLFPRQSPWLVPPGLRQSRFANRLLPPKSTALGRRYLPLPALTFKSQKAGGDAGYKLAFRVIPASYVNRRKSLCFLGFSF